MLGDDLMDFARILDGSCRCLESCGSRIETLTFVRRSFDIAHLHFRSLRFTTNRTFHVENLSDRRRISYENEFDAYRGEWRAT